VEGVTASLEGTGAWSEFNGEWDNFKISHRVWGMERKSGIHLNSSRIRTVVTDSSFTPFLNALNADRVVPEVPEVPIPTQTPRI
jgi:hypothetical protein